MIRTRITPIKQDISLHIPANFIGKEIEVLAFAVDEPFVEPLKQDNVLTHFASEKVLAMDWLNSEEDKAWQDL